jgi:hypothetical protein
VRGHGDTDPAVLCFVKEFQKSMKPARAFIAVSCFFLAFNGCVMTQKITRGYQDPLFSFGQIRTGTTVRIMVADNVDLRDFSNAFEREYRDDSAFRSTLSRQIADSLKTILGCSALVADSPQDAEILADAGIDKAAVSRIQELLSDAREDYFFVVNTATIANRKVVNTPMPSPEPGPRIPGGTSETAMVTLHVDLWNVREKKKVLQYAALGESGVTMFMYGTALKNAVNQAVANMVRYLETGLTR